METIETITTTNKDSMEEEDVELASRSSSNNIRPYFDDQHDDEGEKNKVDDANNNDNNKEETTMAATTTTKGSTIIANNKPHGRMQHLGASRQYWRDLILGVNDGLVSTFLLVAGVAGGGMTSSAILLTAVSGALAGAVSMAAGEYVATKSQNQVLHGEIALEQFHVVHNKDDELHELQDLLTLIGILEDSDNNNSDNNNNNSSEKSGTTIRGGEHEHEQHHDDDDDNDLRQRLLSFYANNSDALLKIMTALEFGVIDKEERTPYRAGFSSGLLFCLGALPSVLPFVFSGDQPQLGLVTAAICTVIMLLVVGAIKTWATRTRCITAALENLIIAGFGGGLAYGVGVLFDTLLV